MADETAIVFVDGVMPIGSAEILAAQGRAEDAANRADNDADRAEAAAEAAASQIIADQRVPTDADRLALTGLADGATVYVIATAHTWQWSGSAWVDLGQGPLAEKADAAEVAAMIRRDDDATDLLIAMQDADGLRTWLEALASDGGPSDLSVELLARAMLREGHPIPSAIDADLLFALSDADGRRSWLEARSQDGGPTDWSATLIAAAMTRLGLLAGSGIMTDLTHIVGWGSSTMEYMAADLSSMAADFGATYVDGGDAGVTGYVTLAQMGVEHALITFPDNTIPASGASLVTCGNVTFGALMRPWVATIGGVSGTLSWAGGGLMFTRAVAGAAMVLLGETPAIPAMSQYRRAVTLLNIGKNSLTGSASADDVVEMTIRAYDWLNAADKKAIVIGHFVDRDTATVAAVRDKIVAVNRSLAARYGDLYVDLSGYLISARVWTDVGIAPSAEDIDAQSIGNIPPSLAQADGIHMTPAAQAAFVTHILTPRIAALGWYA
ncbi:SGNH/GDSL hydrolase family protein [Sinirhodobacter populi]|uniref:SGNH/GDSL hydrolase family protein n=1 Tax=Paenirhodobacter populi TaxID=2306993 RepID=A0A443KFB1_9RHOB|nr:SGNH/GDSL hydrolase family protein [Sinirhodobacter populi]RWR31363.1 SGNH/GDSL hydrolase family protein [Sinirhodobacter populi]